MKNKTIANTNFEQWYDQNKDKTIVVILADSGSRYLSTELYNF